MIEFTLIPDGDGVLGPLDSRSHSFVHHSYVCKSQLHVVGMPVTAVAAVSQCAPALGVRWPSRQDAPYFSEADAGVVFPSRAHSPRRAVLDAFLVAGHVCGHYSNLHVLVGEEQSACQAGDPGAAHCCGISPPD